MNVPYKNILIYCKQGHAQACGTGLEVQSWLNDNGCTSTYLEAPETFSIAGFDCAIVLGGDGTILGLARKLAGSGIPIFGINFGNIGYLTASEPDNWRQKFSEVLTGILLPEKYLVLRWRIRRENDLVAHGVAINDVVISRGALARLVSIHIKINGDDIGILRSDGLITFSPIGSSGYSYSAGGPILFPALKVIGLTPVCPFMSSLSSLVLTGESILELSIDPSSIACYLTIDGQYGQPVETGDILEISGWPDAIEFFSIAKQFYERLRSRDFLLEKKRNMD